MAFEIPEPGSPEMVKLLCDLESRCSEIANEWALVIADEETGMVASVYGPFDEPEQALVEAGRQEGAWNVERELDPELEGWKFIIVPLWGPGE